MMKSLTTRAAIAAAFSLTALGGCGMIAGLNADSTCAEFNAASIDEQRAVIRDLVVAAEDGQSNPLREGNAVMQITYTCQRDSAEDTILGDIAI